MKPAAIEAIDMNRPAVALVGLLLALAAGADTTSSAAADKPPAAQEEAGRLDRLFTQLKAADSESDALRIESQIWRAWMQAGDARTDRMMENVLAARRQHDHDTALRLLEQVIARAPDYPEGWNQRAIVRFERGEYEKSLRDISEALRLEPRHFGALAGRAMIRLRQGKPALAIQNIKAAMEIHPFIAERRLLPALLQENEGD